VIWFAVLAASVGCYALKLAGLSVPPSLLDAPRVRKVAELLPIALLAALVVVQTFATGRHLSLDARAAGIAVAIAALVARAPFLVVVTLAAGVTAAIRAFS
jgi:hypothetical protein